MMTTELSGTATNSIVPKTDVARSERPEVRNPLVALPAAQRINELPEDSRAALRALLIDLRNDARGRAQKCWRTHKAPLALYWKVVSVYCTHLARLLAPRKPATH
jgi:hypothetical protein